MYTPQEVSEKTFPKSGGLTSGYNMTAVDEFLDGLTEDYTALYKENAALKAKLKMLAEKVEEYRATEDAMRSTLLAAQKMAAQMVADAQAEKEKTIAEARAEKERTIADAQAQAQRILTESRAEADIQARQLQQEIRDSWEKLAAAQNETEDFIRRSRELCARQLTFLDSLPERNAPQEQEEQENRQDQQPENEAVTLPAPEENAVPVANAEPAPQEEVPQPESAAEPESQEPVQEESHEEPQEEKNDEESPFPLDFKLNLEDLQFGRNYNGGDRR